MIGSSALPRYASRISSFSSFHDIIYDGIASIHSLHTMSESSLSTRQRSVDSDTSLAPDPKRRKSLDTQRAFRARKAAHVKDLEVKVALQELEIARLKRENGVLQADLAKLRNSAHIPNATRFPDNPSIVVHEHKSTHPSVFQPMPSVMRDVFSEIPVSRSPVARLKSCADFGCTCLFRHHPYHDLLTLPC